MSAGDVVLVVLTVVGGLMGIVAWEVWNHAPIE